MKKSQMIKLKTIFLLVSFVFANHLNGSGGGEEAVDPDAVAIHAAPSSTDLTTGIPITLPGGEIATYMGTDIIHNIEGQGFRLTKITPTADAPFSFVATPDASQDTPGYKFLKNKLTADTAAAPKHSTEEGEFQEIATHVMPALDSLMNFRNGMSLFMNGELEHNLASLHRLIRNEKKKTGVAAAKEETPINKLYGTIEKIHTKLDSLLADASLTTDISQTFLTFQYSLDPIEELTRDVLKVLKLEEIYTLGFATRQTEKFKTYVNIGGKNISDIRLNLNQIERLLFVLSDAKSNDDLNRSLLAAIPSYKSFYDGIASPATKTGELASISTKLKEAFTKISLGAFYNDEKQAKLKTIHEGVKLITLALEQIISINSHAAMLGESTFALTLLDKMTPPALEEGHAAPVEEAHGGAGGGTELALRAVPSSTLSLLGAVSLSKEDITRFKASFTKESTDATSTLTTTLVDRAEGEGISPYICGLTNFLAKVEQYLTPTE